MIDRTTETTLMRPSAIRHDGSNLRVVYLYDPIYWTEVYLLAGDCELAVTWLRSAGLDTMLLDVPPTPVARCHRLSDSTYGIWLGPTVDLTSASGLGIFGHEIFHLTHRVMRGIGMKFDLVAEEAFAYFWAWAFREGLYRLRQGGEA